MRKKFLLVVSILMILNIPFYLGASRKTKKRKTISKEEKALKDRFKKWLDEDVRYIITDEEKTAFKKLTTIDEKEHFIEQFWKRRDPTPITPENEYKEEYYRRIAYANDHFAAGLPGWKTDRGRIYIVFGPPDEIISHPSGGTYFRKVWEGSGSTVAYPFEIWRYRYIPGIGSDVEIEFVDKNFSGNYEMALDHEEKDALIHVPAIGLTRREELGLTNKRDRAYLPVDGSRTQDQFFERLMRYAQLQKAPAIHYNDLKSKVETRVFYQVFPFRLRMYKLWMSSRKGVVPISIEVENKDLHYKKKFETFRAQVEVYVLIKSLEGKIVAEFEDKIGSDYSEKDFPRHKTEKSVYQKIVLLPVGRYKVSVALKDVASGLVSSLEKGLLVNALDKHKISISSLILARSAIPVEDIRNVDDPFILDGFKVIPNVSSIYEKTDKVGVYCEVYNIGLDSKTLKPDLNILYEVQKRGKTLVEFKDLKGESVRRICNGRIVLLKGLPLEGLAPGMYTLKVTVNDLVTRGKASSVSHFKIR